MIRLFIALKIPDEIKKEIIRLRNSIIPDHTNYKWEVDEKIHLTLKFIGNVEDKLLNPIISSLNFIEDYPKLNCGLEQFGFFFKHNEAQILWIGLKVDEIIYNLVDRLNKLFEEFGVPAEKRKFKSHLTLMRIKKGVDENFIKKFENFVVTPTQFIANEVVLIKSELLTQGSKYTEIKKFKLIRQLPEMWRKNEF